MKKVFVFIMVAILALSFMACDKSGGKTAGGDETQINSYTTLPNDKTLYVGDSHAYTNYENKVTTEQYLRVLKAVTYTLRRTSYSYNLSENYVEYQGYYYYWENETVYEELPLGQMTVKNTYTYEYMPYGEMNNINVRLIKRVETTYGYDGGFKTVPFDYTVETGYYFDDVDELREECPELLEKIDISGSKKYYVDVTTPTQTSYDTYNARDTYFYFEENETAE